MTLDTTFPKEGSESPAVWTLEGGTIEGSGRRKRQLEPDDEPATDEATDTFEYGDDNRVVNIRRGRKQGKRVSSVFRELASLHNIGQNKEALELVFRRLTQEDITTACTISTFWYTIACRCFRQRVGNSAFVRLWHSGWEATSFAASYPWINWELHFHPEILQGTEEDLMDDDSNKKSMAPSVSSVQALLSVGNRLAYDQFIHEEAKLPFRQDHIFAICNYAIVTGPNTGRVDELYSNEMVVQSLFIPKSKHLTVKGFSLEMTEDELTLNVVKSKLELSIEDIGEGQTLTAVLLLKYMKFQEVENFVNIFSANLPSVSLLSGLAEEVGYNKSPGLPIAVGLSFYASSGAQVAVYEVDFNKPETDVDLALQKMKAQADQGQHGFCFVLSHDSRDLIELSPSEDPDWADPVYQTPQPMTHKIVQRLRTVLPMVPILGIDSFFPVEVINSKESNVEDSRQLTFGFLMVTYQA